jgi:hypothetical protein
MAYFDIGRHLRRGFTLTVPECLKGRDPNYSIASHRRRLRYLRYRVRHSARAFREYLGVCRAPLALHGSTATVPPTAVLIEVQRLILHTPGQRRNFFLPPGPEVTGYLLNPRFFAGIAKT